MMRAEASNVAPVSRVPRDVVHDTKDLPHTFCGRKLRLHCHRFNQQQLTITTMKLAAASVFITFYVRHAKAFAPQTSQGFATTAASSTRLFGYLDDLNKYIGTAEEEVEEDDSREATAMTEDKKDRFGVGDWSQYVEFQEFDGGDGQMGVAGDGKQGLEKEWSKGAEIAKSQLRSARNAWGSSSGYADQLREQGVETSRAQQLENWHNQQEILQTKRAARFMTEDFDAVSTDESWRDLSKFGVERNQDFDLNTAFGPVQPGDRLEGSIDLQSRLNRNEAFEFPLKVSNRPLVSAISSCYIYSRYIISVRDL
jgi:hypothetical protein